MVRVVLTYGSTSPRLRADLSSLTGRLVSVRVVHGPICLVPINMSLFKVWMILAADDSSRDFSFASVTSAHFSCCFGFSCFVRLSTLQLEQPVTNIPFGSPNSLHAVHATPLSSTYFKFNQGLPQSEIPLSFNGIDKVACSRCTATARLSMPLNDRGISD